MIDKLDPSRQKLDRDNDKIFMICVTMSDSHELPGEPEILLSSGLTKALSHISYGVLSGGGKRHKKSYKRKSNKRTKRSRKIRKTRRHKK